MGSEVVVALRGGDPDGVLSRLSDLEARWSRFRDDSEVVRAGATPHPVVVSDETALLVECAVSAWRATGGRFDPTVVDAMEALGYDRDLDAVLAAAPPVDLGPRTAPGCADVVVDRTTGLVHLPGALRIDAGGIGKGLAADLAATEAVADGAQGALVSIGGDVRVAGEPPSGGWALGVEHAGVTTARVQLDDGALVTSSTLRRSWTTTSSVVHHVVDPRTGRPTDGPAVAVSVVAGEAWWAEAVATAVLVGFGQQDETDLAALFDSCGVLVTTDDGARHVLGAFGNAFDLVDAPSPVVGVG